MAGRLVKAASYTEFPVSKKNYIYFKYFIAFSVKSFFKETKMQEKIFVY